MSYNEQPIITASVEVAVGVDQARRWFLELEKHPERYQFDTHAGFRFIQGNFGQVGARFETEEWFFGLKLTIRFELTDVDDELVRFRVLRPSVPAWCAFVLERVSDGVTRIHLDVSVKIPGADQSAFETAAQNAKTGCPISRLLNTEITMDAKLVS